MRTYSPFGLLALGLALTGCKSTATPVTAPSAKPQATAPASRGIPGRPGAYAARPGSGDYTVVKIGFSYGPGPGPASTAPARPGAAAGQRGPRVGRGGPGGRGGAGGCPATQVQDMLGVHFGEPHGCVIAQVYPGSPVAKSGLRHGDSIVACNGIAVTCPSSLLPVLAPDAKTGRVIFTVHRPKQAGAKPGGVAEKPHPKGATVPRSR